MTYYSLSVLTEEKVLKDLIPYQRCQENGTSMTIHGAFGRLRRMSKYNAFGDYPLLYCTLVALKKLNVPTTRRKLVSCMHRHTTEIKDKFIGKKNLIKNFEMFLSG